MTENNAVCAIWRKADFIFTPENFQRVIAPKNHNLEAKNSVDFFFFFIFKVAYAFP